MAVALRTLASNGGGTLVTSGHQGEAERLAALALQHDVVVEPTAESTWDNRERSLPYFEGVDRLAIASDYFHSRSATRDLWKIRPDLGAASFPPNDSGGGGGGFKRAALLTRHFSSGDGSSGMQRKCRCSMHPGHLRTPARGAEVRH